MSRLITGQLAHSKVGARVRRYWRRMLESWILLAAISPLPWKYLSSRSLALLPTRYKLALGGLFTLQIMGQLLLGERGFPFVRWELYGQTPVGDPEFYEYMVVLQNGTVTPLVLARLMPGLAAKRLASTLF